MVRDGLETCLAGARERERVVPRFVERELRAYLQCGLLCHGFVRARCADCGLDRLVAFSCKGRGVCPACVGRRVARVGDRVTADDLEPPRSKRCAMVNGVSLHANVAIPARDRKRLERLCRYVVRLPVSTARLAAQPDGRLRYPLKRRWRDGTTHVVFEPGELLERLVALIPPPRAHQVRYHGVLAPAAADRTRSAVTDDSRSAR